MKKIFIILFAFILLTGCFKIEMKIDVKKDGSGTIKQKFLFTEQFKNMIQMASQFGNQDDENAGQDEMGDITEYDEEKFKLKASEFGEGVYFVSGKEINDEMGMGYETVYKFDDISKLKISGDPSEFSDMGNSMGEEEEEEENRIYAFDFKKGLGSSTLTIRPFEGVSDEEIEEEMDEEDLNMFDDFDPQQMQMAKAMVGGMRFSIVVNFDGNIKSTNAMYQEGNSIVLSEIDFDKLLENPEQMQKAKEAKPQNKEDLIKILKKMEGLKMEIQDKIEVKY